MRPTRGLVWPGIPEGRSHIVSLDCHAQRMQWMQQATRHCRRMELTTHAQTSKTSATGCDGACLSLSCTVDVSNAPLLFEEDNLPSAGTALCLHGGALTDSDVDIGRDWEGLKQHIVLHHVEVLPKPRV